MDLSFGPILHAFPGAHAHPSDSVGGVVGPLCMQGGHWHRRPHNADNTKIIKCTGKRGHNPVAIAGAHKVEKSHCLNDAAVSCAQALWPAALTTLALSHHSAAATTGNLLGPPAGVVASRDVSAAAAHALPARVRKRRRTPGAGSLPPHGNRCVGMGCVALPWHMHAGTSHLHRTMTSSSLVPQYPSMLRALPTRSAPTVARGLFVQHAAQPFPSAGLPPQQAHVIVVPAPVGLPGLHLNAGMSLPVPALAVAQPQLHPQPQPSTASSAEPAWDAASKPVCRTVSRSTVGGSWVGGS